MEIVIDISETIFKSIKEDTFCGILNADVYYAIKDGTQLPKGHGRLIDADELEPDTEWDDYEDGFISYSHNQIKCANVIIPADKECD